MRLNRRQLLWAGLGATAAGALGQEHWQQNRAAAAAEAEQAKIRELYDPEALVQDAFQADLTQVETLVDVQRGVKLRSPTLPYNRQWSKRLIVASKLSTQQYLYGKYNANYNGNIAVLPLHSEGFAEFQQVASFKAAERIEEQISFAVPLTTLANVGSGNIDNLHNRLNQTRDAIGQQVEQVVHLSQKIPVYYGFLLSSPTANLLIFRGTQRPDEWVENVLALQDSYDNPITKAPIGLVHHGLYEFYSRSLAQSVIDAVQSLDPGKPLFLSGHSLGAALATLAAMDIALHFPEFQPALQVYAYAGPRLGDRAFVEAHSQLIPNHYRIVNLADMIPMLPLSKLLEGSFVHGGEQWSFLSQQGDIMPNHIVETYRQAIAQDAETNGDTGFMNLHLRQS